MCRHATPEYGTPAWLEATKASLSDEEQVMASIALMKISGNRTYECNPKLRQAVRIQLARKVPKMDILNAVSNYPIEEGDRHPGITLADNLSEIMISWGMDKIKETEEQEHLKQGQLETKKLKREMQAQPARRL
jgi:hypothetical protein